MKVAVALSGGVDSFTAALLLKGEGHQVMGLFMYVVDQGEMTSSPPYLRAKEAADLLGVPLYAFDLRRPFEGLIVEPFLREYMRGRTPNPCILCNEQVKFGLLMEEGLRLGAQFFATGHYVRKEERGGRFVLLRGRDRAKDQSYFLWRLTQRHLSRALFPLGGLTKAEVKGLAAEAGYTASRESQEICFIPGGDYRGFLEGRLGEGLRPGPIVDLQGRVIGQHQGIHCFTVGQRRGLGIRDRRPYYVLRIEPETGRVVVGRQEDLYARRLRARGVNWVGGDPPDGEMEAEGQVRHRHRPSPCKVWLEGESLLCEFSEPQRAITPGQALVLYRGDLLLGGGWIEEVLA